LILGHEAKKEELKVTELNKRVEALELAIKALASSQFSAPDGHPFYGNQYTDGSGGGGKDGDKVDPSEIKPGADISGRDLSGMDLSDNVVPDAAAKIINNMSPESFLATYDGVSIVVHSRDDYGNVNPAAAYITQVARDGTLIPFDSNEGSTVDDMVHAISIDFYTDEVWSESGELADMPNEFVLELDEAFGTGRRSIGSIIDNGLIRADEEAAAERHAYERDID
jgi:hypothetical protein